MDVLTLTDQNFDQETLKETSKPVLVDFWAIWCGPCRVQSPIIEELAKELGDTVKVGKMDVDENSMTAQQYQILSIPTSMLFKNGQPVWQGIGLQSKEKLREAVERAME